MAKALRIAAGVVISLVMSLAVSLGQASHRQQDKGWIYFTGEYRNHAGYQYRVVVPAGLTAYRAPSPAPAHGFAIDLSQGEDAHIWVDGYYNAAFYPSALDAVQRHLQWLKEKNEVIGEPRLGRRTLAGLRAATLQVHYRDRKSGKQRIREEVVAFNKQKEVIYSLSLDTTPARLANDEKTLTAILNSFQLTSDRTHLAPSSLK